MNDPAKFVLFLGGVAGAGKTTVGKTIAGARHLKFVDGDAFHPATNRAKMEKGEPLTDDDRYPWLAAIRKEVVRLLESKIPSVIECSALKRAYRNYLTHDLSGVRFVFLTVPYEVAYDRIKQRSDHFFPLQLLKSQFETVELPDNSICVDANRPLADVVTDVESKSLES